MTPANNAILRRWSAIARADGNHELADAIDEHYIGRRPTRCQLEGVTKATLRQAHFYKEVHRLVAAGVPVTDAMTDAGERFGVPATRRESIIRHRVSVVNALLKKRGEFISKCLLVSNTRNADVEY
jgi:hypothetical protein